MPSAPPTIAQPDTVEMTAPADGPPGSTRAMPSPRSPRQSGAHPAQGQPPRAEQGHPAGPPAGPEAQEPPTDEGNSWALVEASQAGDVRAFGELYERYHDVVFRYVLFRMGDRSFAEDITQETFVRALRRIGSVSYQGRDIGAWFVTIARNLIFDYVKSSRYRLESTTSEIVELSPATGGPEQQVLDNATNSELLASIDKLNPDQRECIQLRFLKGLSVAETAELMDRNEGAVKALQHRAVRRLAQLLPEGLR
ncbi:MAG: sigma-70 family RNA polymerase sigma factor [Pseudonocardia sediminis]